MNTHTHTSRTFVVGRLLDLDIFSHLSTRSPLLFASALQPQHMIPIYVPNTCESALT